MIRGTLSEVVSSKSNPRMTVRMDDGATATMYADHPSSGDIKGFEGRPVALAVDIAGTVRDFFSESDEHYPIRDAAAQAGVFGARHDNRRREKLKTFHGTLVKAGQKRGIDPVAAFLGYPYLVMRCAADDRPFGLSGASKIAESLGLPVDVRCRGEVEYDIVSKGGKGDPDDYAAGGGHTCYPSERYFRPFVNRYGFQAVQAAVSHLVANGRLVYDEERQVVASPKAARYRDAILAHLAADAEMADASADADADREGGQSCVPPLNAAQAHAVERAKTAAVTVVIGPAGTGKTRVVQEIARETRGAVWLCAPTGKAARRMGSNARTIHSFLGTHSVNNADLLGAGDLLVVDEASMLDFTVAYKVFKLASESRIRLVFVGDQFQLPSVEWGTVLDDLVAWARKCDCLVELSSVFRQGEESGILRVATSIRGGSCVPPLGLPDVEYSTFDRESDMVDDVARTWETGQIITPTNRVRDAINYKVLGRRGIEKGDKVVCLRNQDVGSAKNGDIGYVVDVRTVLFPAEGNPNRKLRQRVVRFEAEDEGGVLEALAKDVAHAYAITVHKAQGSEWENVCLAVTGVGGGFVNKKLLYTAVTRAKKRLTVASVGNAFLRGTRTEAPIRHSLGLV